MSFMDAIETECELCHGTRYAQEVLEYKYKGKNIAEVMDMTVTEAIGFFAGEEFLIRLQSLEDVGLGYLHLNQAMTTLSGGEMQRVKLASELHKKGAVYILDEPTNGLHLDDVRKLLILFNRMVDEGNTLIVIEHSLDVLRQADYVLELGPEGGMSGGRLLYEGTPRGMLTCGVSVTKEYLKDA